MLTCPPIRPLLFASTVLAGIAAAPCARAQTADQRINAIEAQMRKLEDELRQVRGEVAKRDAQVRSAQRDAAAARAEAHRAPPVYAAPLPVQAAAATPSGPPSGPPSAAAPPGAMTAPNGEQFVTFTGKPGQIRVGGVTVQLGGFIEAAGIFRTRNEVADISSNWNAIPLAVSPLYKETETRFTARQSRLTLLAEGKPSPAETLAAYGEFDLQGAAPTANSNESNSYNPRLRQAYATYDNSNWNLHVLAGQAWSLLAMNKVGIVPRQENIPLTIDAQYVPGFSWTRQPQFRVATDVDDHRIWLAASLENPQTNFYTGPNGAGTFGATASTSNPGGSGFASTVNYSLDAGPDVIVKAAYDPGFGHFEAYGLARFFRSHLTNAAGKSGNDTVLAGGGGAAMLIPIVPKYLDFQASFLAGTGIGRYGSGQLPDATLTQSGAPAPLEEVEALAGLVGHPTPKVDLYGYVGTEQIQRRSFVAGGKGYGYGSPLYSNLGCGTELSTLGCAANTSGLTQGTVGAFYRPLKGSYGTFQLGLQYSYTNRTIFSGIGGGGSANDNIVLLSVRYFPFQ